MSREIVLVDDDDRIRTLLREVLKLHGYETIEARNGRDAVSLIKRVKPRLVLMDLHMPDMDGFETVKKLREDRANLGMKIIVVTACAVSGDKEKCIAAGFDDYIAKPFVLKNLVKRVKELMET